MSILDEFGDVLHVGGRHGQRHGRVSGCVVNTGVLLAVLEFAVLYRIEHGSKHGRVGGRVAHKIDVLTYNWWPSQGNPTPIGLDSYLGIKLLFGTKFSSFIVYFEEVPILKRILD